MHLRSSSLFMLECRILQVMVGMSSTLLLWESMCLYMVCLFMVKCSLMRVPIVLPTRIKEYLTMNKQTMYKHIESQRSNVDDMPTITWRILHSNINNDDERKCIEAFVIKKGAGDIINGCIGRTINI